MRPDSRRPGDLSFAGTHPTGRAGTRPTGRAGSRPRGAPGPSTGSGGGDDGGVIATVGKALGCAAIVFPLTLATLGLSIAAALAACQPRTGDEPPRPLQSGVQPAP